MLLGSHGASSQMLDPKKAPSSWLDAALSQFLARIEVKGRVGGKPQIPGDKDLAPSPLLLVAKNMQADLEAYTI